MILFKTQLKFILFIKTVNTNFISYVNKKKVFENKYDLKIFFKI